MIAIHHDSLQLPQYPQPLLSFPDSWSLFIFNFRYIFIFNYVYACAGA